MAKEGTTILGLRFDNHVSIGHILTTCTILVTGISWATNTEARISYLENRVKEERVDRQHDMNEIKELLKEIRLALQAKQDKK